MYIDKTYRMGEPGLDTCRLVFVKFKATYSKMAVKSSLNDAYLKDKTYGEFNQYPQVEQG